MTISFDIQVKYNTRTDITYLNDKIEICKDILETNLQIQDN